MEGRREVRILFHRHEIISNTLIRTHKIIIHTPTMVQKGGGLMEPPLPAVFDMLQYFETILPLVKSLTDLLNKMRYILWVVALLEACDVTNNGCILATILDFTKN